MSRPQCPWYPGALYHITSRGTRRSPLFYHDADYIKYFDLLMETGKHFPFKLHAFCLMTNHVHLMLEAINDHPKNMMQKTNHRYAHYFNKRYDLKGHVFQGPYHAEQILNVDYKLAVSKYIHLNPVKAGLVTRPEDYKWSSASIYLDETMDAPAITTADVLGHFPAPRTESYKKFLDEPDLAADFKQVKI